MIKRFLKFLLVSFLSFIAFIVFILIVAAVTMGPHVKENSVLVLELSGPLPEEGPKDWKEKLLVGEVLTTRGVLTALEKAKTDNRIKALLVTSLYSQIGTGKAQELRAAIKDFAAQTKKPVYGFVEEGTTVDYYICSAAPKLFMPPDGDSWFTLLGVRAEVPFFKGTFDKLGIVAQMDHVGQYKSGSEIYTRDSMSEPDREATTAVLDSLFNRITTDIASDRKIPAQSLQSMINQAPFIGQELKQKRLVDDLLYKDQIEDMLKKQLRLSDIHEIDALEYQKPTFSESFSESKDKIAIIYATGAIMPGESSQGFGEDVIGSSTVTDAFSRAREDTSVKAIVFRVDSPGGSPSASDAIWREVTITAKKKPVVVSMADVAASGGYYISMGATKILADPSTFTGSIGVYGGKFYLKGLYDKIGMNKEVLKRGEHADLFSDYVPFSDEEWQIIHRHMNATYDSFTRKAAQGRNKSQQQIHEIAQGRVWTGDQGLKIGLVDRLGGFKDAIEEAKKLAHLKEAGVVTYPGSKGGFGSLFSSRAGTHIKLPADLAQLLSWAKIAEREHILLLMPYKFSIN